MCICVFAYVALRILTSTIKHSDSDSMLHAYLCLASFCSNLDCVAFVMSQ